jgi:putative oxidoreductase
MRGLYGIDPGWGITVVRVTMAAILIAAGYGKVMGGVGNVSTSFAKMGIPLPEVMGPYIAFLELVGGVLILIGLFGRWIGLLVALEFIVATFYVKMPGQGWLAARLDLMLLAGGLMLFLAGSGRAAVDELWLEKRTAPSAGRRLP